MAEALRNIKYLKLDHPNDARLGRNILHDEMSRRYAAPAKDPRKLRSITHNINIPMLDQGYEGSCTGHTGMENLAGDAFWPTTKKLFPDGVTAEDAHQYARGIYMDATKLDPWEGVFEPDDTGSDGLSVAKVLQARGLISGYRHAFSLEAALTALAEGPVMVGTVWLDGMYDVSSDGRVQVNGTPVGGHEYTLDRLDVENRLVGMLNHWGEDWAQKGRAWITWNDMQYLLNQNGDCTILVPLSMPAPQPQPEPPPKVVNIPEDDELFAVNQRLMRTKGLPKYWTDKADRWMKVRKLNS